MLWNLAHWYLDGGAWIVAGFGLGLGSGSTLVGLVERIR